MTTSSAPLPPAGPPARSFEAPAPMTAALGERAAQPARDVIDRRMLRVSLIATQLSLLPLVVTSWQTGHALLIVALHTARSVLSMMLGIGLARTDMNIRRRGDVMAVVNAAFTLAILDAAGWGPACAAYIVFEVVLTDSFARVEQQVQHRAVFTVVIYAAVGVARGAEPALLLAAGVFGLLVHLHVAERTRALARIELAERTARDHVQSVQRALLAHERMVSLGVLSAGVAHEINNPLAYVNANLRMLAEDLHKCGDALPAVLREHVDESVPAMLSGVERIGSIVADLSRFARGGASPAGELPRAPYDLRAEARLAARLATGKLQASRCVLSVELGEEPLPQLVGSGRQIAQAILNLLTNAADAARGSGVRDGHVTLRLRRDGAHALIEVEDDGPGIPDDVRVHLFEPFFTTKPVGEGSGLGLAVVHGVVTTHDGSVEVRSQPGATVFSIRLPLPATLPAASEGA